MRGQVQRLTLSLQAVDLLRERIFSHELLPGQRLDEADLAATLGISRTPLREALKVLAVEGLVTMKVRRGAYVTEMSRDDVAQVYHLLALLESDAARAAAARATDTQRPELRTLHDRLERQVGQRDAFVATNEAFFPSADDYEAHDALLCVAGGTYVSERERRRLTPEHRLKSAAEMRYFE